MKPQLEGLTKAQRRMPLMQAPILTMWQAKALLAKWREDQRALAQALKEVK